MGASVQFIHKITETDCHSQLFAEFIQTQKRYPNSFRQNKWSNLKTANHIWPKFFLPLWTKLLEKLPLEKYPISVPVTLMESSISKSIGYISYVSYHLSITAGDQWKQEKKTMRKTLAGTIFEERMFGFSRNAKCSTTKRIEKFCYTCIRWN